MASEDRNRKSSYSGTSGNWWRSPSAVSEDGNGDFELHIPDPIEWRSPCVASEDRNLFGVPVVVGRLRHVAFAGPMREAG